VARVLFQTIISYPRAQLHWHKSNVSAAELVSPKLAVPGRFIPPAAPPPRPPRRLPPPPPATESARGKTRMEGARLPPPNIPPVSANHAQQISKRNTQKAIGCRFDLDNRETVSQTFPFSLVLRPLRSINIAHGKEYQTRIYQHTITSRPFDSFSMLYARYICICSVHISHTTHAWKNNYRAHLLAPIPTS